MKRFILPLVVFGTGTLAQWWTCNFARYFYIEDLVGETSDDRVQALSGSDFTDLAWRDLGIIALTSALIILVISNFPRSSSGMTNAK